VRNRTEVNFCSTSMKPGDDSLTKKLDREFARFDVDLLDSAEYMEMAAGIRNDAYLYLLVLNGWSRKHRTDGIVPAPVAETLAKRMLCQPLALLGALARVGMVALDPEEIRIVKYPKWQETKAEIEASKAAARERQSRHRHADVTRDGTPGHATERERELEREKENGSIEPPVIPLQQNRLTNDYGIPAVTMHVSEPTQLSETLKTLRLPRRVS
jgi:hypothetical protein